ncbi:MAG: AIR synthase family protein [Bacillota bacterium]
MDDTVVTRSSQDMILPAGKVPPEMLKSLVFKKTGAIRKEVLLAPSIGEDTSVLALGGELLVVTTDPITGAGDKAGWLAVKVALNDLGAAGAEPIAVMITLLLPEGSTVGTLTGLMDDIHSACTEEDVAVAGGHTEITPGLTRPVISVTALGKSRGGKVLSAGGAKEGDDILVTKWAGMEGTSILVRDFPEEFRNVLTESEFEQASDLIWNVSVTKDGAIAAQNGASGCHDATEGGVLGAIYEVCEASGLGAYVDADLIPVLPVTAKVAAFTGIDPLKLVSSGCLVISAKNGAALREVYRKCGLQAEVVGKMTVGNRTLRRSGREMQLEPPVSDELWRARARLSALSGGTLQTNGR